MKSDHFIREDPVPLAYSLAFVVPEVCFGVGFLSMYMAAWLDFSAEVTISACQHGPSSKVLKSVDSLYKAFIRLIWRGGMPEELIMLCLTYTENGYVVEVLMSYLSHFGFLFCHSFQAYDFGCLCVWFPCTDL